KRQRARAPMSCQLSSSGSWHSSSSSGGPHVFFDGWPAHGPLPGGATVVEDDSAASSSFRRGARRAGSAAGLGAGGGRTAGRAHARAAAPHAAQAQAGAHRQAGDGVVPDGPGGPQGGGEQLGRVGLWGAAGGEPLGRLPRRAAGRGLLGRSGALRGRG
ncbi:unnamed protein product, partial [Prorocentrum cordatum]